MANLLSSNAVHVAVETSPKRQKWDWNGSLLHNALTGAGSAAVLPPPLPELSGSSSSGMTNEGLAAMIAGLTIQSQQIQTTFIQRLDSMQHHVDVRFDDVNGQTRMLRQEFDGFRATAVTKSDLENEVARQCAAAMSVASAASAAASAVSKADLANEVAKQCAFAVASAIPTAPASSAPAIESILATVFMPLVVHMPLPPTSRPSGRNLCQTGFSSGAGPVSPKIETSVQEGSRRRHAWKSLSPCCRSCLCLSSRRSNGNPRQCFGTIRSLGF